MKQRLTEDLRVLALCLACLAGPGGGLVGLIGSPAAQETSPPSPSGSEFAPHLLSDDVRLGLEIALMFSEAIGIHDDPDALARLSRIGYRIASITGDANNPYSFQILDLPEPNAMALPGGFIFVTRGILDIGLTDDELGHLMGHEVSHIRQRHFARAARLNTLMSVLQTALTVGLIMGMNESSSRSYDRVSVSEDPGLRNQWAVGMTGPQAVMQASSLFGSVVRALFDRGYGRKLEFEADEIGSQLAVAAGFAPDGGVRLMEKLHERSFEGHRFSYWRTHPFFDDRVARARARAAHLRVPTELPTATPYRQDLALFFARAASEVRHEGAALYLYACALRAEPAGLASLSVAHETARFKWRREQQRHPLFRRTYPVIEAYDFLLDHAALNNPDWTEQTMAQSERDEIEAARLELLEEYISALATPDVSTGLLERFLENYPHHGRAGEITHLLAEHYLLSKQPSKTIDTLGDFLEEGAAASWADTSCSLLLRASGEVLELEPCYRLATLSPPGVSESKLEPIREAGRARFEILVKGDVALDEGGRFLQKYAETPWSDQLRSQVWQQARELFENGRVSEGLRRYQDALDAYFMILALAPDAPAAEEAESAIARLNLREELQNE